MFEPSPGVWVFSPLQNVLAELPTPSRLVAASNDVPPWLRPRSAYLHVPFCRHHCGYCDFAVVAGRDSLADSYLDALEKELAELNQPKPMETIFIGGGTPTHLSPQQLERLMQLIQNWLPLNDGGEFSIESTPDSLDEERIRILADHGVNRVSIGIQSFRDATLQNLDRQHSSSDIIPAVERVKKRIDNFSLDLIFGVPGQSITDWRSDLAQAAALEPNHLSCYGLTFEKGTPLWKQLQDGQVQSCDEESERSMFVETEDLLTRFGYEHYEISNYAQRGYRCRHNETYWANHAYHGFGVGSARYVDGRRELNSRSIDEYLHRINTGRSPTIQSEKLNCQERALETIVVQLRRSTGIERDAFAQQTGWSFDELAGSKIQQFTDWDLIVDSGSHVRLTRNGWCVADSVLAEFWQMGETSPMTAMVSDSRLVGPARFSREAVGKELDID